jgi:Maltokinase N-terminal cap domain
MALLHRTTLVPSKLELLAGWLPKQPWFEGDPDAPLATVASFRFDDPEGQVGVETLLVRAGNGPVLQVPLTYRNEERPGAEEWFIGTMEHGVLGTRWVYDATGDPVYCCELARVILSGGTQVELWTEIDGAMTLREPTARVAGSGSQNTAEVEAASVEVVRVPGDEATRPLMLTGTWTDHPEVTVLARLASNWGVIDDTTV